MAEFWGSSRRQAGLDRSAGPKRRYPVKGWLASFVKCVHSRSGWAWRAPASSSSTSRPRAASSFATTGPPPPAPITITSCMAYLLSYLRWSRDLAPVLVVPFELVAAVRDPLVVRERPAQRGAGQRALLRVKDPGLRVDQESDELRQDTDEGGEGSQFRDDAAFEKREDLHLLGERQIGEWSGKWLACRGVDRLRHAVENARQLHREVWPEWHCLIHAGNQDVCDACIHATRFRGGYALMLRVAVRVRAGNDESEQSVKGVVHQVGLGGIGRLDPAPAAEHFRHRKESHR